MSTPTPHGVTPTLSISGLKKSFGGVQALKGVGIEILPGEVHGLLGENGSGKSTLIKVLAGFHQPEEGELLVHGKPVKLPLAPGQFRSLGMSFVHQDLGLVPTLTVIENLRIAELANPKSPVISWSKERRRARETFAKYGVVLDPSARVSDLLPVERALLAIVRAVEEINADAAHHGKGLLILDEPTVFLPKTGADKLFALVREITATGASVLFVSHDLDEVSEITDRVTVFRDGSNAGTIVTKDANAGEIVEMIIGRKLTTLEVQHHDLSGKEIRASVRNLTGGSLEPLSFDLHAGEVFGVTGLAGSGFEQIPYLLFGAWKATDGRIGLDGNDLDLTKMSPSRAISLGVALIPADRQKDGSVGSLSIVENITLPVLNKYFNGIKLDRRRMAGVAAGEMTKYDVRPNTPNLPYGSLSGGNQQKALLAKWMQTEPSLLLLHEPTQGVDVGAREQIYTMIRAAAASGMSVICASSDYEQLATICDRVYVFGRGAVVSILSGPAEVTKERITEQCYNSMSIEESVVS